jgi:hypothetical protein
VDPAKREAFEKHFSGAGIGLIGRITDDVFFRVKGRNGTTIIEEPVQDLKEWWKKPFGHLV